MKNPIQILKIRTYKQKKIWDRWDRAIKKAYEEKHWLLQDDAEMKKLQIRKDWEDS